MLSQRLQRIITRGKQFIPIVDGLRFVAIAAVILFHMNTYVTVKHDVSFTAFERALSTVLSVGDVGVHLFFVLSGFLLALPFAKWRLGMADPPRLTGYYLRRLTRLEPPYVISMLVLFAGGYVALGAVEGASRLPNLLAGLVYQHNSIYEEINPINGVAWSLEVEVQFYLLAPLLASVFSIRSSALRRGILLAAIVALPALRGDAFHLSLPGFLELFLAGFVLADLYLVEWREAPTRRLRHDLLTIVAWPTLLLVALDGRFTFLVAPTILIAYVGAFRGRISGYVFSARAITTLGGMCYSMYLLHYAVISVTGRITQRLPIGSSFMSRYAAEMAFALPAILAATVVSFILVERPCMDPAWPAKLRASFRAATRPIAPARD